MRKRHVSYSAVSLLILLSSLLLLSCGPDTTTGKQGSEPRTTEEISVLLDAHTASSTVIAVTLTDRFHPELLETDPNMTGIDDWRVNDMAPKAIFHYARSVDELPKQKDGSYPVSMTYWTYLELEAPLENGKMYTIEGPYGEVILTFDDSSTFCESIKVNQAGYHPDSPVRYANLGVYLGTGGSRKLEGPATYRVRDLESQSIVFTGTAAYRADDTAVEEGLVSSGEHVYRLDLAEVPQGGPYQVEVDGFGRSYPFEVSLYAVSHIAEVYARGLYHQRCGIALEEAYTPYTRETCHTEVADTRIPWSSNGKITPERDDAWFQVSGGYHDAGDFDRRPQHTIIPILMLSYYEAFPGNFSDGELTIPESGNSIPDFLDEALWGMSIWEQLLILDENDPDYGGIRAGTETDAHPEYGKATADTDGLEYGTWAVSPEVTGYGAGMMAQAARLLSDFPPYTERAMELYDKAGAAWSYLEKNGDADGSSVEDSQKSEILYASGQLYLATAAMYPEKAELAAYYHQVFKAVAKRELVEGGSWPDQYVPGNTYATCTTAHFISYLIADEPTDEDLARELEAIIRDQASKGGYQGVDLDTDPYPQGVSKGYGWGAATAQGRYADVYIFAYRLSSDPAERQRLFGLISQLGDYALGLNPLGISFVTGLGSEQPQSILHLDSYATGFGAVVGDNTAHAGDPIGSVPGILVFGPTEGRSGQGYQKVVSDTLYPAWEQLPLQRRWADGWSLVNNNEFSVWETMVWNICLYGFLDTRAQF